MAADCNANARAGLRYDSSACKSLYQYLMQDYARNGSSKIDTKNEN